MGFRIVKINNRSKLETQLNYLVCRNEKETRILLDDISVLIIENQQVCITAALMSELINHKVRVMFCDSKHNPQGELMPYSSCFDSSSKIRKQVCWEKEAADILWKDIVRQKITNQALVLKERGYFESLGILINYLNSVELGDTTNREGLAAKSYFPAIFGTGFDRREDSDIRNTYLNYGYSLILGMVNREISISGYLTQLGIHHIGNTNPFNLGCDLMEPIRPLVDRMIIKGDLKADTFKGTLLSIVSEQVLIDGRVMILENAIRYYVLSFFQAMLTGQPKDLRHITFPDEQL